MSSKVTSLPRRPLLLELAGILQMSLSTWLSALPLLSLAIFLLGIHGGPVTLSAAAHFVVLT